MKTSTKLIAAAGACAIAFIVTAPFRSGFNLFGEETRHGFNTCRMLSIAIQSYYHNKKASSGSPSPPTLQLLVENNYLDSRIFTIMREETGTYVISYPPSENSKESFSPLIQYFCKKGIAEMRPDGSGGRYSWDQWTSKPKATEQGAAANP
jgi:hypothetical protein